MSERFMQAGDTFICDFGDVIGSEQGGLRPAIVVSNQKACAFSDVVYVVPITSQVKKYLPQHYKIYRQDYPFFEYDTNIALCEQTRPISKKRIKEKIGWVAPQTVYKLIECIKKNFLY